MSQNELKWYLVGKIGSRINKYKILSNWKLCKMLKAYFKTNNVDVVMACLVKIGFIDIGMTKEEEKKLRFHEYQAYVYSREYNSEKRLSSYHYEKARDKRKIFG